jgi:glycosyltransferase involved in cell wall biosynthesis
MTRRLADMRLLIVSHVVHYRFEGRLFAYGPYAREIDLWADLFRYVVIASPLRNERPPGDCLQFTRSNISVAHQTQAGGDSFDAKLGLIVALPRMILTLLRAMARADAIHVRCPGNLGLLGVIFAPLFRVPLVAKYAAQWNPAINEPWSAKFQKFVLRSRWWKGPVTVYGKWPNQPQHVIPFFTSLLTEEQMTRARRASGRERTTDSLKVLYTGRLSKSKHVDSVLRAVATARAVGCSVECTVIGQGPERPALESLAANLNISEYVEFTGGIPFEQVTDQLERADVLVLISETEGWPKSIAEGMAFGLVCIGSNTGFVPEMLADGRGFVVSPGDEAALSSLIIELARYPTKFESVRQRATEWARQFSLEGLKEAIRQLLLSHWNERLRDASEADSSACHDAVGVD